MLTINRNFQPVVLTQEQTAGLVLKPGEHNVQIVNEPRLDATFKQFLASVSGTVQCLGWYNGCLKYAVSYGLAPAYHHKLLQITNSKYLMAQILCTFALNNNPSLPLMGFLECRNVNL